MRWALETCASEPQTQSASFFHLKTKPKQQNIAIQTHTFPPRKTQNKLGRKTGLPLVWVKSSEVIQRTGNEDNMTSSPDACFFSTLTFFQMQNACQQTCPFHQTNLCVKEALVLCPSQAGKDSCSSQGCRVAGPVGCDHHQAGSGTAINSKQLKYITELEGGGSGREQVDKKYSVYCLYNIKRRCQ